MGTISSFRREVITAFFWAIILKLEPIRFPETSVSGYYFPLRNSPEQRSS